MIHSRRVTGLTLVALQGLLLLGAPTASFGQSELSLGVDTELQSRNAAAEEVSSSGDTAVLYGVTPWASAAASFYGYPSNALSWFFDAAGRAAYEEPDRRGLFSGSVVAGGSLRRGLSVLTLDADAGGVVFTGAEPARFDAGLTLGASTGSAAYALYGETAGSLSFSDSSRTLAVRGQLGGSLTLGSAVAPDLALTTSYREFAGGDDGTTGSGSDDSQTAVGIDLSIPWYPPQDFAATFRVGARRSFGTTEYFFGDASYLPDRYWEYSWGGNLSLSLSRRVALDLKIPGFVQFYTDHGPVVDGVMQEGGERVVSFSPAVGASVNLSRSLVFEGDLGGELIRSNSPYRVRSGGYLTVALRYQF